MKLNNGLGVCRLALAAMTVMVIPGLAFGQWLSWGGGHPSLVGQFAGGSGAYAGVVTAQASNIVDGLSNGVLGINPFFHSAISGTYLANGYPLNPGNTLDYMGVTYNDSGDSYVVTMDFSGLANGYLPSGSLFAITDMDINENAREMTAFDPTNTLINTPWLNAIPGLPGLFDFNSTAGDLGGAVLAPTQVWTGSNYSFMGQALNEDSAFLGFTTGQDIRSLSFHFSRSVGGIVAGTGGYGIAIQSQPVPEAMSMGLLGAGLAGVLVRRRRRKN